MELHEPKKKNKIRIQPQQPLPIIFDEDGNLITFTAHLSALGTVIGEPDDMAAVHSMGFFGKGSLSRSYPAFGRARYGVPPVIKKRQWIRRMKWVEEVKQLSLESCLDNEKQLFSTEVETTIPDVKNQPSTSIGLYGNKFESSSLVSNSTNKHENITPEVMVNSIEIIADENAKFKESSLRSTTTVSKETNDMEILKQASTTEPCKKSLKFNIKLDEVIFDSVQDEELYEIPMDESNYKNTKDQTDDIFCLQDNNDETTAALSTEEEEIDSILEGQVLVLTDSDSDTENYLKDIKPKIENEGFPVKETLHLTFEETFFLMYGLGCLQVIDIQGKILSIKEVWDHFCKEDIFFVQKYVVYHYYRSKGWVVKPGLKYGGDFLLYKQGPPFYHASYIVIIEVVDAITLTRIKEKSMRRMKIMNIIGMERLSEASAKEILLTQVLWPDTIPKNNLTAAIVNLSHFTIKETLWRRWRINKPSKTSNSIQFSDEEEDSS